MIFRLFQLIRRFYYFIFDRCILYPILRVINRRFDIQFLNLGYLPLDGDKPLAIETTIEDLDQSLQAHLNLYEKCLSLLPHYPNLNRQRILEVGSGAGGGLRWIQRLHPEIDSIVGLDRIPTNPPDDNISVIRGLAESMPFPDSSFDLIINVESSHLYADCSAFFRECARVLTRGGYLCWTDIRFSNQINLVLKQAESVGLRLLQVQDITSRVLHALPITSHHYDTLLAQAPWPVRLLSTSIRATYCAPGTYTHDRLLRRDKIYATACWRVDKKK